MARDESSVNGGPERMEEISRRTIHAGKKFSFENVTVRSARGGVLERQVVRHPGSVVILPILESEGTKRIVMIRNYRIAPRRVLLELPAGTMEPPEPADVCAARELEEETGYAGRRLERLTSFYTTPGMTDEYMHAFVATGLEQVGQHLEPDESIVVELVKADAVAGMMESGAICDGKTLLVVQWGLRNAIL